MPEARKFLLVYAQKILAIPPLTRHLPPTWTSFARSLPAVARRSTQNQCHRLPTFSASWASPPTPPRNLQLRSANRPTLLRQLQRHPRSHHFSLHPANFEEIVQHRLPSEHARVPLAQAQPPADLPHMLRLLSLARPATLATCLCAEWKTA